MASRPFEDLRYVQLVTTQLITTLVLVGMMLNGLSATAADQLTSGTSSRQAKQQAMASIPFNQLTPTARMKISDIVEKPSIYRRLPITAIDVDPDYFVFLVRHPEVIVNIWQIMGVTKMSVKRTGPYSLQTNDGVGADSKVELIYGTNNLHVFYGEGVYAGPVLRRKLTGRCVLVLRTEYLRGEDGEPQTKNSLDVFLKVENATASLIAKTLNPIVGSTADHNFVESLNFVQRLNETTEKNGIGVQRMADRLHNLSEKVRDDFVRHAGIVFQRSGNASSVPQYGSAMPQTPAMNYPAQYQTANQPQAIHPAYGQQRNDPNSGPAGYRMSSAGFSPHYFNQPNPSPATSTPGTGLDRRGYHPPNYHRR